MYILGISCFYHDAAACLIKDNEIIACVQEERFTRKKHDDAFPLNAIHYCLKEAKITINDIDWVAFYEKPLLKFERLLDTYIETFPGSFSSFKMAIPIWIKRKMWIPEIIRDKLEYDGEIAFIEHHLSHAASAFYTSGFNKSAILTIDGVGEWATTTYGKGKENQIKLISEIRFPHSLGLLYNAFTYYLGFKVNADEYKVMGLSAYGKPVYFDKIMEELIDVKEDGSFSLNMKYFGYHYGLKMINEKFYSLFGMFPRRPESEITRKHCDIAASIQRVTEEIILKIANNVYKETQEKNLCMAGGVALNCVANGRLLRESPFDNIFIQPAASDAGGALGAALYLYYSMFPDKQRSYLEDVYLGPSFSQDEIERFLIKEGIKYKKYEYNNLTKIIAKEIARGRVIGWFQGRMEWGPRALGNRSILADPRNPEMKDILNKRVKHRESFRPFAPAILLEYVKDYFEIDRQSPFMLFTAGVKKGKEKSIPSALHIDNTARLQTVSQKDNPLFYNLIYEFYKITGIPVLINTSFNLRGEPIVCTPEDAYSTFKRSEMDILVIGNYIIEKEG